MCKVVYMIAYLLDNWIATLGQLNVLAEGCIYMYINQSRYTFQDECRYVNRSDTLSLTVSTKQHHMCIKR